MLGRLYHGSGEHEVVGTCFFYLAHDVCIPFRAHIHIVVHVYDVVLSADTTGHIYCNADTCIVGRMGIVQALFLCPLQGAIAAIVDVQYHLVRVR